MDTTLAINPGSSSKKYSLFRGEECIFSALYEHTTEGFGKCVEVNGTRRKCEAMSPQAYARGLYEMIDSAIGEGAIRGVGDITRVLIRVVAPGTYFTSHRPIDAFYTEKLASVRDAAPLHIPHIEEEIHAVEHALPGTPLFGMSDSAFHSTVPPYARVYGIPRGDATALDVYRFGYHGLSASSAIRALKKSEGVLPERVVVAHIGSGISVTAVQNGMSVCTTMGFAPASGLIMGTRAGDLDPAALLFIQKKKQLSVEEMDRYVSKEGGLKGMAGTSDLRIVLERSERGDSDATLALDAYFYRIRSAIGSAIAAQGGIDALVFTGTAAERNATVRARIGDTFSYVGLSLDRGVNEMLTERDGVVSSAESRVRVSVVRADEMREMVLLSLSLNIPTA